MSRKTHKRHELADRTLTNIDQIMANYNRVSADLKQEEAEKKAARLSVKVVSWAILAAVVVSLAILAYLKLFQ